jgi:hypothetical protein
MKSMIIVGLLVILPSVASAQAPQPYAGMEARTIKTLSAAQIEDLRAGRGMGLALAAELNGYPGPKHVLELADQLALSATQRSSVQTLFARMTAETVPIGETLIAQETELNRLFAEKTVTPTNLGEMTSTIGGTQATLRAAHLKYHLMTLAVLNPAQIERYSLLRGYGGGVQTHEHHGQHSN